MDVKGTPCPYVRDRSCSYRSIFGAMSIGRACYYTPGASGIFPLDSELKLPKRGYPIGGGVIEGVSRNRIDDRLELTGMSWTREGVESVMRLRAFHLNEDWDAFWNHR